MENLKIIAECAQGFEGSLSLAKELVTLASKAKADIVKFQLIVADELCTEDYVHYKLFKSLELTDDEYDELHKKSLDSKIDLCFDIFGFKGLSICQKLGVTTIKIHPTDLNNYNLLEKINSSNVKRVILGIGGAEIEEVKKALNYLKLKNIVLLLGFQGYPTPLNENRIQRITSLRNLFDKNKSIQFGFADHEDSKSAYSLILPAMAISAGASFIEKHFTTSKLLKLEDSETALNPDEFEEFVQIMKNAQAIVGDSNYKFELSPKEVIYRAKIRRHVVASVPLKKGEKITAEKIKLLRTSAENPIYNIDEVMHKILKNNLEINQPLKKDYLI